MKQYTTEQLFAEDFNLRAPFQLILKSGELLDVEKVLRYLPGKRLACQIVKNGRLVFAKIFSVTSKDAFERELRGIQNLEKEGFNTAEIIEQKTMPDAHLLLQTWLELTTADNNQKERAAVLGQLHGKNLIHTDPHPNNFIQAKKGIYILDAGAIKHSKSRTEKQRNMALFIAQHEPLQHDELANCLGQSGKEWQALVKKTWNKRKKKYLNKIFRESTEVSLKKNKGLTVLSKRQLTGNELKACLEKPEFLFETKNLIKDGNSAKIYKLNADGKDYIVKQYINKDWIRKIRRAFHKSRAEKSWYFSHAFLFMGASVPEPIALIERRRFGIVTSSWFISNYVSGTSLLDHWSDTHPKEEEIKQIHKLFSALEFSKISHGDMKATNIICENSKLFVIDFDGSKEHFFNSAAKRAIKKDKKRFLKNWDDAIQKKIQLEAR